jgi:hypothetical protein
MYEPISHSRGHLDQGTGASTGCKLGGCHGYDWCGQSDFHGWPRCQLAPWTPWRWLCVARECRRLEPLQFVHALRLVGNVQLKEIYVRLGRAKIELFYGRGDPQRPAKPVSLRR